MHIILTIYYAPTALKGPKTKTLMYKTYCKTYGSALIQAKSFLERSTIDNRNTFAEIIAGAVRKYKFINEELMEI